MWYKVLLLYNTPSSLKPIPIVHAPSGQACEILLYWKYCKNRIPKTFSISRKLFIVVSFLKISTQTEYKLYFSSL